MVEVSCQTDLTLDDLRRYLNKDIKDPGVLQRRMTVDNVKKNDHSCKFYTGEIEYTNVYIDLKF